MQDIVLNLAKKLFIFMSAGLVMHQSEIRSVMLMLELANRKLQYLCICGPLICFQMKIGQGSLNEDEFKIGLDNFYEFIAILWTTSTYYKLILHITFLFRFLRQILQPQLQMIVLSVNLFWCLPSKNISISTPILHAGFPRLELEFSRKLFKLSGKVNYDMKGETKVL